MPQDQDVWPNPTTLEGVKSRKRAIFKVGNAEVSNNSGARWTVSKVEVSLESRIAAVGDGAQALVDLLLGNVEENSGAVSRHASLAVVRVGPHIAGSTARAEDHAVAVAGALKAKPHVVVLEEACDRGGAGWAKTFQELIRGDAISAFKGAVIVACSQEPTFAIRRACLEQWSTMSSQVQQQEIPGRQWQIIEDALKQCSTKAPTENKKQRGRKQAAANEGNGLLEQARTLSEYWFEQDLVQVSADEGWTLALLIDESSDGNNLKGFICYHILQTSAGRELKVERLAVPKPFRRRGLGSVMMRWIIGEVARMPVSECSMITCHALSNVVGFYEALGFATNTARQAEIKDQEDEDPSVFMELPNSSLISEKDPQGK